MSEELLDIVNVRDEVIDRRARSEVHERRLLHRSIHVLVFHSSGQVFLQKRSMNKDEFPGRWDASISGHLNAGESYDACAIRESMEELGLTLDTPPRRLFKLDACAATGFEFSAVYQWVNDGPFELDPVEIDSGRWFSALELEESMSLRTEDFTGPLRLIWSRVRQAHRATQAIT